MGAARLLLGAVVLALPLTSWAQACRWKDDKGQSHYAQIPPTGRACEPVRGAPPPGTSNQDDLNRALQESNKAAPAQREAADKAAEEKARRDTYCNSLRERLAFLDSHTGHQIRTTDAQGNPSRMTDDARQQERASTAEDLRKNCE